MLKGTTAFLFPFLLSLSLSVSFSSSSDTLTPSQSLTVNQTLISSGKKFELGFFSPGGNSKLYLGIWYYNLPVKTIVWVANRDSPARTSSISLKLANSGQILIGHDDSVILLLNNQTNAVNPVLQLLDSGNLVLRENDDAGDFIWQSFDYPTDNLLPGQKLGWDKNSGMDRYLTAWRSTTDPSTGNYSFRLNRAGDPEAFMLKDGIKRTYRSGPWVGLRFSGVPEMKPSTSLNFTFHDSSNEVYYMFNLVDPTIKSRLMVDPAGNLNRFTWVSDRSTWTVFWFAPKDQCDDYMECGSNGVCNAGNLFVCGCPPGFGPSNPPAWNMRDGSDGCVRKTRLDCGSDGFRVLKDMKLPESGAAVVDESKSLDECKAACRRDCNCTAFANRQVAFGRGSGCVMWRGELKDMRTYNEGGQDLYIRLAAADLGNSGLTMKVVIGILVAAVILLLAITGFVIWKKKRSVNVDQRVSRPGAIERSQDFLLSGTIMSSKRDLSIDNGTDDLELPLYDFDAMVLATNNFSEDNKLGQGGFGCVYKGVLVEGEEEMAVKRLSKESGQGVEEFKNEVKLIAKLQHRNLVRLLGCCVDKDEKMLIYEYLPNRSLDSVLFHKEKCLLLDWQRRFNIICGIARGLLYLHHDSRFRIIHRDLKASNILLDRDMNPKISDFGMARIFGGEETDTNNTRRVVGTYGYMAPEYAMDGVFSIKSDVFSFGVLVLEIVTGKKNRGFYNSHHELNLLGYAWKLWKEGKGTELLDAAIGESYSLPEVLRCIQVGLLCVQERAEERPAMSSVVLLLSSETASLPQPKIPGFCLGWKPSETDSSSSRQDETFTVNHVTVTMIDGR